MSGRTATPSIEAGADTDTASRRAGWLAAGGVAGACRAACGRRTRLVRGVLWAGVAVAVVGGGFPYVAPMLLGM